MVDTGMPTYNYEVKAEFSVSLGLFLVIVTTMTSGSTEAAGAKVVDRQTVDKYWAKVQPNK